MRTGGRVPASLLAAFDCFVIAGLVGVYLKWSLLGPHWGAIARFLGKNAPDDLTIANRLGFFFHDIWLNLLAIPLAGVLILYVIFRRYHLAAAFVTSAVLSGVYFVELQTHKEVGEYLSGAVVADLLGWTMTTSITTLEYVTAASLLKLGVVLIALSACIVISRLNTRAERLHQATAATSYRYALAAPMILVSLGAALSLPVAYASRLPDSALSVSSIGRAARMLLARPEAGLPEADARVDSTLAAFRQLTHTPEPGAVDDPYAGGERESDVIVFMMETGAARALDFAERGRGLPGAGRLFPRAFVAGQHYTTHPYSSDALYSVFSGRYPQGRRRVLRAAGAGSLEGLMTNVADIRPIRRVYVPSLYHIELDDRMYEAFGAESVYAADEIDDGLRAAGERRAAELIERLVQRGSVFDRRLRARLERRLRSDFQALEKMKLEIAAAIRARQRYVVMFFPEIGHGPWLPLHGEASVLDRGRALMELQDQWLREVLDLLESLGRLEHTVVVLTSDHGVRTKAEDPSLPVGWISDYMFGVPLLVYAPQTLTSTVAIEHPTSHIDVAPTILSLLGQRAGLSTMQGVAIWQRSRRDRIYLLAFDYGGAEGFIDDGRYYMRQGLSGAVYASDRFMFGDANQVPAGVPEARFVTEGLTTLDALQQTLVSQTVARSHR